MVQKRSVVYKRQSERHNGCVNNSKWVLYGVQAPFKFGFIAYNKVGEKEMCEWNVYRLEKVFENLGNVILDNTFNMVGELLNYMSKQVSTTCILTCMSFQTLLYMKFELCEVAEVREDFTVRKCWTIGWSVWPVLSLQFVAPPCWLMSSTVSEWRPFFNIVCFQCQQLSASCKHNRKVPKYQTKFYQHK